MLTSRLNSTMDRMLTLNRALDHALGAALTGDGRRVWVPALDLVERQDAYVIFAELPGVNRDQIELSFEQNVLTIRGSKTSSIDPSQGELRVHMAERVHGSFERAIRMPDWVDGESIRADFANGVLTVTVPKAQAAQPRKIEIGSGSARQIEG
jgi:HSP20 family protein